MSNSCCGIAGWLFGHKFKPRFDDTQSYPEDSAKRLQESLARVTGLKVIMLSDDVDAIRHITSGFENLNSNDTYYVGDVCTRCGASEPREPEPYQSLDADVLLIAALENMHGLSPVEWDDIRDVVAKIVARIGEVGELPKLVTTQIEEADPAHRSELMKTLLAELLRRKEALALLPTILPIECPSCHVSFNPLETAQKPGTPLNPIVPLGDEVPAEHMKTRVAKVCPRCFHNWLAPKDEIDPPCPMCRDTAA